MQETDKVVIIEFVSFGWRWGPPSNTKKNWNLRKLPNPPSTMLKRQTGLDKELQRNLFEFEQTQRNYARWCEEVSQLLREELERMLLPSSQNEEDVNKEGSENSDEEDEKEANDDNDEEEDGVDEENSEDEEDEEEEEEEEGVLRLRLGFGCHSGRHRSVAVVERLSQELAFQNVVDAFEARLCTTTPQPDSENCSDSSDDNASNDGAVRKIGLILQARHRDLEGKGKKGGKGEGAQTNKERRGGRKRGYEERRQRKQAYYS